MDAPSQDHINAIVGKTDQKIRMEPPIEDVRDGLHSPLATSQIASQGKMNLQMRARVHDDVKVSTIKVTLLTQAKVSIQNLQVVFYTFETLHNRPVARIF